jgi:hypothetical protein
VLIGIPGEAYSYTSTLDGSTFTAPWQHMLHSHHALELKAALLFEPGVVVASIPRRF